MKRRMQQGFTLIELMIVIAIVGILAAIAIPMYQDYTVRSKVTEGISVMTPCKLGIADYYSGNSAFPTNNAAAGCDTGSTKYTSGVAVSGSTVTATFSAPAEISGGTIVLTATVKPGTTGTFALDWGCTATIAAKYKPSSCR